MTDDRPPTGAVLAAFCYAAAAAPVPVGLWAAAVSPTGGLSLFIPIMMIGIVVALIHVIVLAAPAYLLVRLRWPVTWWNASIAGVLIGGMPAGLLLESLEAGLTTAAAGVAGGLAFWFALRDRTKGEKPERLRETFS